MQIGKIAEERRSIYRNNAASSNVSIELPAKIEKLITGSDYWRLAKQNRYKKLIREGHLRDLLELADFAASKRLPANWFAKVCSKARWESTLEWLRKVRDIAKNAAEVARRLNCKPGQMKAVYKACWSLGGAVIRKAVHAEEVVAAEGGNALKLFNYLCWRT